MPKTYYLANNVLNLAMRGIPFTPPAAQYVTLYTVLPGVGGGGTEVSGGSFARQLATFTAPVNGQIVSTADVLFPVATAIWGTVVGFSIMDASSGGNMLYFAALSSSRLVDVSDQVRFPAGSLVATEA